MKKYFTYILVFIASTCFWGVSSCSDKKDTVPTAVELLGFGYAGAKPGETIQIIGNNLQKVTAVEFSGGANVAAAAFAVQTQERIVVAVPVDANPGPITLKTTEGDITSKSVLNLLVEVEITSFTNETTAGGLITVQGNYLNWVRELTITGANSSDRVRVFENQSRTTLTFKTPAWLAPGTYSVSFACGGTKPVNLTPAESFMIKLPEDEGITSKKVVFKKIGDVSLSMTIYAPEGKNESSLLPAIVFFYGGGWNTAAPDQFAGQAKALAKEGMIAVTADYRVKNIHGTTPFDALDDARSAVAYLREHANELGINPDKLAAGGGSAGGQLAAATDLTGNGLAQGSTVSCRPNALVLFNPVFNNGPGQFGNNDDSRAVGDRYPEFSPYHNIKRGAAPTIVFLGTSDKLVPVSVAQEYKRAMEDVDSRCDLHLYEGQEHGFFNTAPYYAQTLEKATAFLRELGYLPAKN